MGPIAKAPFYAVGLYPGDIGTNGGLLTDEYARVLGESGAPIPGLYATGNCTASVMGRTYPGAGATIGPSAVFGYIGARHAAGRRRTGDALNPTDQQGSRHESAGLDGASEGIAVMLEERADMNAYYADE